MDYYEILAHLLAERKRVDDMIQVLESLQVDGDGAASKARDRRRGRKSMGPDERKLVAERMRRYWAERKNGVSPTDPSSAEES